MIRYLVGAVLIASSSCASAFVFQREAPLPAGTYTVQGAGAAAEFQRVKEQAYRTGSGRSLPHPITDVIRPGKANIAKNLAKRLITPGGPALLAASILAPAVLSMFSDDGQSIQNGTFQRAFTAYRFTSAGNVFAGNLYYENHTLACQGNYPASLGYDDVYATTSGCADTYGTCWDGGFRLTANCAIRRTTQTQSRVEQVTEAQLQAAVMNEPDTDTGLAAGMSHLVEANHPLTFDGTEQASLSIPDLQTAPYDVSTKTRPDGATETRSTVDKTTTTATGNGSAVAGNKTTTTEQKVQTETTPEGTTVTVTNIENNIDNSTVVEGETTTPCGAADKPCQTVEQGTFQAPAVGDLPVIPGAKTFQQSTVDFMAAVNGSPLFAFVQSLSIPAGGACPTVPITIDYLSFAGTFDSHCAIVDQIAPVLASVMLAFWLLVAIRRVMSA